MAAQFSRLAIDAGFVRGVDAAAGQHLPFLPRTRRARWWRSRRFLPGEIGCFASHYGLWESCAAGVAPFVVLEDDIEIGDDFAECLRIAGRYIDRFGLIRLSALSPERPKLALIDVEDGRRFVRFLKSPWGTQGYMLSPGAARQLLRHCEHWIDAVDFYLDQYWVHGVETVALLPSCVRQFDNLSSLIQNGRRAPANPVGKPGRLWLSMRNSLSRTVYNFRRSKEAVRATGDQSTGSPLTIAGSACSSHSSGGIDAPSVNSKATMVSRPAAEWQS